MKITVLFLALAAATFATPSFANTSRNMFPDTRFVVEAIPVVAEITPELAVLATSLPPCNSTILVTVGTLFAAPPPAPGPCSSWVTCPEGETVDFDCIANAKPAYEAAVVAAAAKRDGSMDDASGKARDSYDAAVTAFNACTDTPMNCDDIFCVAGDDMISDAADSITWANLTYIAETHAACVAFQAAIANCCKKD